MARSKFLELDGAILHWCLFFFFFFGLKELVLALPSRKAVMQETGWGSRRRNGKTILEWKINVLCDTAPPITHFSKTSKSKMYLVCCFFSCKIYIHIGEVMKQLPLEDPYSQAFNLPWLLYIALRLENFGH